MKFCVSRCQDKYIYLIFILLLYGLVIVSPWCFDYKYNYDLSAYASILDNLSRQTLIKSISNNTFLFYFIKKIFNTTDNYLLINVIHNISITILFFVLIRYADLKSTLTIIFIGFFSLFLGQIKGAIALAFCIVSLFESEKKIFKSFLFILLALLCHFFVTFLFVILLLFQKIFIFFVFISLIILYFYGEGRYQYYILIQRESNLFFIIPLLICIILRKELGKLNVFFLLLVLVSIFTASLYSFSNRLSEMLSMMIVVFYAYLNKNKADEGFEETKVLDFHISNINLVLILSSLIFLYKFLNIVVYNGLLRKYLLEFFCI